MHAPLTASPLALARSPLFVTWNKAAGWGRSQQQLRGCIGTLEPRMLHTALKDYALTRCEGVNAPSCWWAAAAGRAAAGAAVLAAERPATSQQLLLMMTPLQPHAPLRLHSPAAATAARCATPASPPSSSRRWRSCPAVCRCCPALRKLRPGMTGRHVAAAAAAACVATIMQRVALQHVAAAPEAAACMPACSCTCSDARSDARPMPATGLLIMLPPCPAAAAARWAATA